jgi:hypothetical protein
MTRNKFIKIITSVMEIVEDYKDEATYTCNEIGRASGSQYNTDTKLRADYEKTMGVRHRKGYYIPIGFKKDGEHLSELEESTRRLTALAIYLETGLADKRYKEF